MQESERFEISQSALIVNEDKLLILQLPNKKWVFVWWKINKNENYIDNISVWKQKATWNITFPLAHKLKDLWFWVDDFLNFKKNILKELWWVNFENYKHQNIDIMKKIFSNKCDSDFEYFISARNKIEENRVSYCSSYWRKNR